ncbi:hypothetical protein GPJ56_002951 [Histomonas meleagridis]|uniref:uncharacterized protein n=1 Tax=Histomonas meleagridis TaxID=135588 RepID=UPI00355A4120|nr:hypothetical protein GPJ56_002951 [Histomonas meleagridis]KAH0796610.1 hypothetical protein GO595_010503 [Histomonas meleagridis]
MSLRRLTSNPKYRQEFLKELREEEERSKLGNSNSSTKDELVGFAFSLGMKYIQDAINFKNSDPEKAETAKKQFLDLVQNAKIDVSLAAVYPNERLLMEMKLVNDDKLWVTKVLHDHESSATPDPQISKKLKSFIWALSMTYDQLLDAYTSKKQPPQLITKTFRIERPVINQLIEPNSVLVKISNLKAPDGKYIIALNLDDVQPRFPIDVPGDTTIKYTFSGIQETPKKKINKFRLSITLLQIKKSLLKKAEEVIGTYELPITVFSSDSIFANEASFKVEKKTKNVYSMMLCCAMREPLAAQTTETVDKLLHLSPSIGQQGTPAPSGAPRQAPAKPAAAAPKPAAPAAQKKPQQQQQPQQPPPKKSPPAAAPPPQVPDVFVLPDYMLQSFISVTALEMILPQIALYKDVTTKNKIPQDPKIIKQGEILEAKRDKLVSDIQNEKLSMQQYADLIKKQIVLNIQKIKQLQPGIEKDYLEGMTMAMRDEHKDLEEAMAE